MTILILYATTEGQTRKIARRAASHLTMRGHSVELVAAAEAHSIDYDRFVAALLLASIHAGHYQRDFVDAVSADKLALDNLHNAFVSVSLSAASSDAEDKEAMEQCAVHMSKTSGWSPYEVIHVAGAFRFAEYDFLKTWAMRWIAAKKDPNIDTSANTEYTNWDELYAFLDRWTAKIAPVIARSA